MPNQNEQPKILDFYLPEVEQILRDRGKEPELPLKRLSSINKKIWGIHKKKLTIVGARTSNCKSAFVINIAFDLALDNHSVLFLSLEMPIHDIIERMFCMHKKVDNIELLHGNIDKYKEQWKTFCEKIKNAPLVITDMIGKNWKEIDDVVAKVNPKPEVIIVDHLQEARGAYTQTQKNVIDEYLKNLRTMAIKYNFAAIVCSQINRASQDSDDKSPQLHQLKSSGYVEEGADIVFLLHWPYHYNDNVKINDFKINIAKNRNGRTGFLNINYCPEYYLFEDVPEELNEYETVTKQIVEGEWDE